MKNCFRARLPFTKVSSQRHPRSSSIHPRSLAIPIMAALDGLIILDSTGRPIITSHFRAHPSNYPLVHIDAYNQALARRKPSYADTGVTASVATSCAQTVKDELEPVLWVTVPVGGSGRVKRGKGKQMGNAGYADDSESDEDSEDEEDEEEEEQAATWQTVGLCHLEREGMSFLVPLSQESELQTSSSSAVSNSSQSTRCLRLHSWKPLSMS
jgi:hypothetical protein